MSSPVDPVVLVVDDEPEKHRGFAAAMGIQGIQVIVRRPAEIEEGDLLVANVIAVDYVFDWNVLSRPPEFGYWPVDGLALSSVIARHLVRARSRASIVLRTGAVAELAKGLPRGARISMLSAQNGLDWILEKGTTDNADTLRELASATAALEPFFGSDAPEWNEGCDWLRLPSASWREAALAEIQVCRPPEHAVATYTAGSAWLRWFTQRVLPFPSFLISDLRAATILNMPLPQFDSIINDESSALGRRIRECQYSGHLSGLVDARWWRAGLDSLMDEVLMTAGGELTVGGALASGYTALHGSRVSVLSLDQPVVTIDADYLEDQVAEYADCVRLAPDAWPVFADEPFALRSEAAEDEELTVMVARGDRSRVFAVEA